MVVLLHKQYPLHRATHAFSFIAALKKQVQDGIFHIPVSGFFCCMAINLQKTKDDRARALHLSRVDASGRHAAIKH